MCVSVCAFACVTQTIEIFPFNLCGDFWILLYMLLTTGHPSILQNFSLLEQFRYTEGSLSHSHLSDQLSSVKPNISD